MADNKNWSGDSDTYTEKFYEKSIEGLTKDEAVAFLLDALNNRRQSYFEKMALATYAVKKDAEVRGYPGHFQKAGSLLLVLLWERKGRVMPYAAIYEKLDEILGNETSYRGLVGTTKRMRRAIDYAGWPLEVYTLVGVGYSLMRKDPQWVAPWESAEQPSYPSRPATRIHFDDTKKAKAGKPRSRPQPLVLTPSMRLKS